MTLECPARVWDEDEHMRAVLLYRSVVVRGYADASRVLGRRCSEIGTELRSERLFRSQQGYELLAVQYKMTRVALGWGVRGLAGPLRSHGYSGPS